jgi:hypothetical protein
VAHRLVVCFIGCSLAHKRNVVAAPASCKRKLGAGRNGRHTESSSKSHMGHVGCQEHRLGIASLTWTPRSDKVALNLLSWL